MKKLFTFLLTLSTTLHLTAQNSSQHNIDVMKNLEIFNTVYTLLDLNYVDSLDSKEHLEKATKFLLHQIDPYNEFYSTEHTDDLTMMRTGKYAGVGAIISYNKKTDRCIISEPYEGMPADKAGLKQGDVILAIDGKDMGLCGDGDRQDYSSKVSNAMRGEPGTTLRITVQRKGNTEPLTFDIVRETIALPAVDYYGILKDNIGYISLNSYTENAANDMRQAFNTLKADGATKIIIDLRQNGGGLMKAAVDIINLFLPKDLEIVTTKGRAHTQNESIKTVVEPLDTEIPIVVLTSASTASAAEITAGALQDYDRAVVMGRRTYGKGLVQQSFTLPYYTRMKITTSKYYIPSGRCVQAYKYENGQPQHLPDSLAKTFYTKAGRPVLDSGGITPDVTILSDTLPNLLSYLAVSEELIDYVVDYRMKHPTIAQPEDFHLTAEEYKDFQTFIIENGFTYDRESSETLKMLRQIAEFEGYAEYAKAEFDALEAKLQHNEAHDFKKWEKEIRKVVESAIINNYYYQRGATTYLLRYDNDVDKAIELLNDPARYQSILQPK